MTGNRPPRPPLTLLEALPGPLQQALSRVWQRLDGFPQVVVAYSGGVDSALVAALAVERLGARALAVTGVSPALAPHLREEARRQAHWLGIGHRELPTAELDDPAYASNPAERCYACKRELHGLLVLGVAGGLSTWSSLAVDVAGMIRERRWSRVALHVPVAFGAAVAIVLRLGSVAERFGRGGGA